ncbi:hypothetical protein ADK67_41640 [Saccharothrix sp. NRRL B-16348]|uniref:hypothetical protein n=1 Tax=Saccharothrix sp. NRRL B-16348 TaxID=1415542 RepID=UPI0006AFF9B0|nr:hypothetical protein [Saccharothrix sp. NRRL B-16348]KOX15348.1 hypothetical protein ADK67_41640 [Saccharothrix sp. NRRL B-16348]
MIPIDNASEGPSRRDLLRAAVVGGAAVALPIGWVGSASAGPRLADPSPAGFHIGSDGRLHTAGSGSTTVVSPTAIGPAGGNLSTVRRADGTVAVFAIGSHGGLIAGFTSAGGSGMGFVRHPQGGLAPPGGRIAAVEGQAGTHVHFTGANGAVYHALYSRSGAVVIPPAPLVQPGSVLPSTPLAAFQVSDRFGVVFVGANGGIRTSVGRIGTGPAGPIAVWTTTAATPANVATPNSPVAAVSGTAGASAFFTGVDGRLWRIPFSGLTPQPVVALSSAGAVPIGAHLAATTAPTGEFVVTYAGADGAIRAATDAWRPYPEPWVISPPGSHLAGGPHGLVYGGNDYLYLGWCGVDRWFWLLWWWLRRPFPLPPPPPDPYHELRDFRTVLPTRQDFNVGVALPGMALG